MLELPDMQSITYEPFWFCTFRIMRLEFTVGPDLVEMLLFEANQVNYPLAVKGSWKEPGNAQSQKI